jgi:Uma2 family endonuclease
MTSFAIPKVRPLPTLQVSSPPESVDADPGNGNLPIPPYVVDHESFRRWARSDDYPKRGRFAWLNGMVWMDFKVEQIFSHNTVKNEFIAALLRHVNKHKLGHLLSDRVLVSNDKVGLSAEPDVLFVSYESETSGKAIFKEGARAGVIEVEGVPDMTLEVVSDSSVTKDTVNLKSLYYQAGVQEYWIVDARRGTAEFAVLKRGTRGFVAVTPSADGFTRSVVFGAGVRLRVKQGPTKRPIYSVTIKRMP